LAFQLSPRERLSGRMKILILSGVLLTLIFMFLVPEYTILTLFSPIIPAIIFVDLNRPLRAEKA
jgi:hypothetical protein